MTNHDNLPNEQELDLAEVQAEVAALLAQRIADLDEVFYVRDIAQARALERVFGLDEGALDELIGQGQDLDTVVRTVEFEFVRDDPLPGGGQWREVSPSEHSISGTWHVVPYDGRLRWMTWSTDEPHGGVEVAIKHNGTGTLLVHTFTTITEVLDLDLPVRRGDTLIIHARSVGNPTADDLLVVLGMEA